MYHMAWARSHYRRRRREGKKDYFTEEYIDVATLNLKNAGRLSGDNAKILEACRFCRRNKIDICMVQELKESKSAIQYREIADGYRLVYVGQVGVILSPTAWWACTGWEHVRDRCLAVIVQGSMYLFLSTVLVRD